LALIRNDKAGVSANFSIYLSAAAFLLLFLLQKKVKNNGNGHSLNLPY
jgi:hypothetical protein